MLKTFIVERKLRPNNEKKPGRIFQLLQPAGRLLSVVLLRLFHSNFHANVTSQNAYFDEIKITRMCELWESSVRTLLFSIISTYLIKIQNLINSKDMLGQLFHIS